jgi:hypothetical protein
MTWTAPRQPRKITGFRVILSRTVDDTGLHLAARMRGEYARHMHKEPKLLAAELPDPATLHLCAKHHASNDD